MPSSPSKAAQALCLKKDCIEGRRTQDEWNKFNEECTANEEGGILIS